MRTKNRNDIVIARVGGVSVALTPLDIQNKVFSRAFRGYNPVEVDAFLDEIVREMERLAKDNSTMREQIEHLTSKVTQYEKLEDTLHNALLVAQQAADEMKANAEKEAQLIIEQAKRDGEAMIASMREDVRAAEQRLQELYRYASRFRARVKGLLTAQLSLLEDEGKRLLDDGAQWIGQPELEPPSAVPEATTERAAEAAQTHAEGTTTAAGVGSESAAGDAAGGDAEATAATGAAPADLDAGVDAGDERA